MRRYSGKWGVPAPFVASLFPDGAIETRFAVLAPQGGYTRFEQLAILSIRAALDEARIDPTADDVRLVLSSTKGNVELLGGHTGSPDERVRLGVAAKVIAGFFGFAHPPVVVSNACISGVHAQIVAQRLLAMGLCKKVVVCGCDVQSEFIVSGFQSFKALSSEPCKPFDAARDGLNLGEAAATMVLSAEDGEEGAWHSVRGAVRNDANHISGPSRTGEGSYRALRAVVPENKESLGFVSVHGTATPYNDEMESIAIERAGLIEMPVCGLKGYFGHTMGAAGVLETILSVHLADEGIVPATRGFETLGVSRPVRVSAEEGHTAEKGFVKLLSGFGGCNAAVAWTRGKACGSATVRRECVRLPYEVRISDGVAEVNGRKVEVADGDEAFLVRLYRSMGCDYPKFYKMDGMSRLGFLAVELFVREFERMEGEKLPEETAVVFAGREGCLDNDRRYQRTIASPDHYFPGPALFVYTLPNIATGEVAIRHKFYGETAFFYVEEEDRAMVETLLRLPFCDAETKYVVGGWVDYRNDSTFAAYVGGVRR